MQDGLDPTPGINNAFATIPDVPVDAIANRVAPRQVASGVTRGIQQLGGENVYSDGGNSQIIVKDSVPRVLMGNQTTFGEGFYVSKSGVDATTNTDAAQWIFNSNQNVFKVVSSLTTTIPGSNMVAGGFTQDSVIVPHNLSSIPVILAYGLVNQFFIVGGALPVRTIRSYVAFPYDAAVGSLLDANVTKYSITVSVDATNVNFGYCYVAASSGSGGAGYNFPSVPVRYYLLQETAT